MTWQTVIGLEVHAQLKTDSKLFSGAATEYGASPNSQTSFIDAGLPGVLPILNQNAVRMAIQFGLAIDAQINDLSYFERKNYFYPDLPKGYQISQLQKPIVSHGELSITLPSGQTKLITIERAHLEEDAGKSIHDAHPKHTGIDLNRAGIPLLEIVTSPCLFSADEAKTYLKTLHQLLRFLDICDGNMQEGSFRCDVNISLRPSPSHPLGVRTELKNLNSFRYIEKAIAFEARRHQDYLETGQLIVQETRLYCPDTNTTKLLRNKENEVDYRYFPDPDLLPIKITEDDLTTIKKTLPTLPDVLKRQLKEQDNLSEDNIDFLLSTPATLHFYNAVKAETYTTPKTIVNWLKGVYVALINEQGLHFETPPVSANQLACLLNRLEDNIISATNAKRLFAQLINYTGTVDELIASAGYQQENNSEWVENIINQTIKNYPQQVLEYQSGKEKLLSFFVGIIMKEGRGKVNAAQVGELLKNKLAVG